MKRLREELRRAAEEFANRIYDALRADLLDVIEGEVARIASSPSWSRGAITRQTTANRVVAFVSEHPGASPKQIVAALGVSQTGVINALGSAIAAGTLEKTGARRSVRYFRAGSAPSEHVTADATSSDTGAAHASDTANRIVDDVYAWIAQHPGCRSAELAQGVGAMRGVLSRAVRVARERGAIRMVGTRNGARYYPAVDAAAQPVGISPSMEPAAASTTESTTPATPATRPAPQTLQREDGRTAQALVNELDRALTSNMHPIRLGALLQAIVAELRQVQPRLPAGDRLAIAVDRAFRRITAVRAERALGFIVGLKRDAEADWGMVAAKARHRVATFDRDSEEQLNGRAERHSTPEAKKRIGETGSVEIVDLPALRELADERPIVLVGGIKTRSSNMCASAIGSRSSGQRPRERTLAPLTHFKSAFVTGAWAR